MMQKKARESNYLPTKDDAVGFYGVVQQLASMHMPLNDCRSENF